MRRITVVKPTPTEACCRGRQHQSPFENLAPMIREKIRMRPKIDTLRTPRASARINKPNHRIWHSITGHQDREIIVDRNQATVEHPMHRAAERDAVAHGVRPSIGDWSNVRGLDLQPTSTIYDLEAGNRAGILISCLDRYGERSITKGASDEPLNERPIECQCFLRETEPNILISRGTPRR